tara:strand:- start:371 stop:532 length:162 start_codon:yes stop_codon:yes gene_type:complete
MKFSFKSKPEINQSLDIVVPSKEIEEQVLNKLKQLKRMPSLKGFEKERLQWML